MASTPAPSAEVRGAEEDLLSPSSAAALDGGGGGGGGGGGAGDEDWAVALVLGVFVGIFVLGELIVGVTFTYIHTYVHTCIQQTCFDSEFFFVLNVKGIKDGNSPHKTTSISNLCGELAIPSIVLFLPRGGWSNIGCLSLGGDVFSFLPSGSAHLLCYALKMFFFSSLRKAHVSMYAQDTRGGH